MVANYATASFNSRNKSDGQNNITTTGQISKVCVASGRTLEFKHNNTL